MLHRINIRETPKEGKRVNGIFIMYFTILRKYLLGMKLKTIYIKEDLHTELKVYCAKNKLKLNQYVEEILRAYQKTKK